MSGRLKKIIGCAIALLIALGSIPVSLLYFTTPIVAEGQLIKLYPTSDTFVYSEAKNKSRERLDEKNDIIGNYWNTYYKFDLSALGTAGKNDVGNAKLRLFIKSSGIDPNKSEDSSFCVSYLENNNWSESMSWSSKPSGEEQYICTASAAGDNSILQIDITEFIKKASEFDDRTITLKLSPTVSTNTPLTVASVYSDDPSMRPCLKISLSDASDSELTTPNKANLNADAYVSKAAPDKSAEELLSLNNGYLAVDNGSAAYLKFNLEPRNILGAVKKAVLKLRPAVQSSNTKIDVYYLKNNNWNTSSLTYNNRPEGEAKLIHSYNGINIGGGLDIDVTEYVYDLIRSGEYTMSLILDGTTSDPASTDTTAFYSSMSGFGSPNLVIDVTDDPAEVAIAEAKANILGKNTAPDSIIYDLPSSYTAENGLRVNIKWVTNGEFSLLNLPNILKSGFSPISQWGKITRPAYLENPVSVRTKAELSVGGSTDTKAMTLTIMPEFGMPGRLDPLKRALNDTSGK